MEIAATLNARTQTHNDTGISCRCIMSGTHANWSDGVVTHSGDGAYAGRASGELYKVHTHSHITHETLCIRGPDAGHG